MTIKVKDAVLEAAKYAGVEKEVASYLDGSFSSLGEEAACLLLSCFQAVENELARDYLPLLAEDELVTATGVVEYAALEKAPARVLCVEDEWGNSQKYKLFPSFLKTKAGKVKIIYAYAPSRKELEGESDYKTGVSLQLFAYGMAAEYFLVTGETESASAWDKKYKDAVRAAYRVQPCKRLRSRRWI